MVVGYLAKNIVHFDKIFRLHIKSQSWQFYNNHELTETVIRTLCVKSHILENTITSLLQLDNGRNEYKLQFQV